MQHTSGLIMTHLKTVEVFPIKSSGSRLFQSKPVHMGQPFCRDLGQIQRSLKEVFLCKHCSFSTQEVFFVNTGAKPVFTDVCTETPIVLEGRLSLYCFLFKHGTFLFLLYKLYKFSLIQICLLSGIENKSQKKAFLSAFF